MVTLELFSTHKNPKQLSPSTLAFIGDAVFELLVREYVISKKGSMPVSKLHKATVNYVCAASQFKAAIKIEKMLTEEEADIYRRGRNATGSHVPRNSRPREYRAATGIECLFGFLYLQGDVIRLQELFVYIISESQH